MAITDRTNGMQIAKSLKKLVILEKNRKIKLMTNSDRCAVSGVFS